MEPEYQFDRAQTYDEVKSGSSGKATRKKRRTDKQVAKEIREIVAERDPSCRFEGMAPTNCGGKAEWCHLRPRTRAQTRNMPPEYRHTREFTLMACDHHHDLYDAGVFDVIFLDQDRGADGPIQVERR